jgi:hypothetical protein
MSLDERCSMYGRPWRAHKLSGKSGAQAGRVRRPFGRESTFNLIGMTAKTCSTRLPSQLSGERLSLTRGMGPLGGVFSHGDGTTGFSVMGPPAWLPVA